MTLERRIARAFRLDEDGWARHANPWSGWSRVATLPLLAAAVWSRVWLGWWAVVPIVLVLLWIWLNPRAFGPAPDDFRWMSRGVLGERLWTERDHRPVPVRHRTVPHVLSAVSALGLPVFVWGLVALAPWPTALGLLVVAGGKLWFIDRMALLYDDMVTKDPGLRYRGP